MFNHTFNTFHSWLYEFEVVEKKKIEKSDDVAVKNSHTWSTKLLAYLS